MTAVLIFMAVSFAGAVAVLVGYLHVRDRQHADETGRLLAILERERHAHRADAQALLQRIQAPEMAVVQHMQQATPDENPYPLTEQETVEAQDEKARIIAQIERMEREGAALGFPE